MAASSVFIDTSGWMALLRSDEAEHINGLKIYDSIEYGFTTNYVLAELVPLANARGVPRSITLKFIREIESSKSVRLVWITNDIHEQAMTLLDSRLDKNYSLCDAVSFIVMREFGLNESLTTDKHFQQEGFTRLLSV